MDATDTWFASMKVPEVAAAVSALAALMSLLFALVIYWKTSQGKVIVTWRLREPALPVVDVIVKNIGAGPVYNVKAYVPSLSRPIVLPVLSAQDEIIIDTLADEDDEQTYRVTRGGWFRKNKKETSTTIDLGSLTGMKLGGPLPLTRIATMLDRLEATLADTPILRKAMGRIGVSRPGEAEWLLPPGVRGVLLPSSTRRKGIHTDTAFGDARVQRRVNDQVVDQPQQRLRIVMDETISPEEDARIREYFAAGSEFTLHWHNPQLETTVSYLVRSETARDTPAVILERGVTYVERVASSDDDKLDA